MKRRGVYYGSLFITFAILLTVLFVPPATAPPLVRGLQIWARVHWPMFCWIMVAIGIVDFVPAVGRFQTETSKKIEVLEKQVAELKNGRA